MFYKSNQITIDSNDKPPIKFRQSNFVPLGLKFNDKAWCSFYNRENQHSLLAYSKSTFLKNASIFHDG